MAKIEWPLKNFFITDEFGAGRAHTGIDLAAPTGTGIYATDDGVVSASGNGRNNSWMGPMAGLYVLIRHAWGYSGYAHMNAFVVHAGQSVKRGQLIGYVGSTGMASGPHCHFETLPLSPNWANGISGRVNPRTHTLVPQGSTVIPPVTPPKKKEIKVIAYHREDKYARNGGRTVAPGAGFYLHTTTPNTANAENVAGGIGAYSLTGHLYAQGQPGDVVRIMYVVQNQKTTPVKNSTHYTESRVIDKNGLVRANAEFKRGVADGDMVFLRFEADAANTAPVKVTALDSDGYLFKVV